MSKGPARAAVAATLRKQGYETSTAADAYEAAARIAHAVRNPLQVARLVLETADAGQRDMADAVGREIDRVRRAVDLVAAYGGLSAPAPHPVDLSPLLADRLAALEREGVLVRE